MPDTRKRVQIVSGERTDLDPKHYRAGQPVVLVDGEPLQCVTSFRIDHDYGKGFPVVELTLIGVDVDFDITADPRYVVRVVGPSPEVNDAAA